jgi:hypothetical protein
MACGVFFGGSVYGAVKGLTSGTSQWLAKWLPRMRDIAKVQANVKASSDRLSPNVVHGIPWHDGVTLLFCRSGNASAIDSLVQVRGLLRDQGIRLLPGAESDNGRGWAQFVLADARQTQEALAGHVPSCIGIGASPARRPTRAA